MTSEREELENTIDQLTYCADNIFQDEFQEKIDRHVKKLEKQLEKLQ